MDDQPKKSPRHRQVISTPPIFLDRESAAAAMTLSIPTFLAEVKAGRLPQPRRLSANRVGWLWAELVESAQRLPVSDLLPPPNTGNRRKAA